MPDLRKRLRYGYGFVLAVVPGNIYVSGSQYLGVTMSWKAVPILIGLAIGTSYFAWWATQEDINR